MDCFLQVVEIYKHRLIVPLWTELSRTGDTKLKVHLEGQATEVHLIRNSFLCEKYWMKVHIPPFMQNFYICWNIEKLRVPVIFVIK
jgi:hypothetical protein